MMTRYQCVWFGTCPMADACTKIEIRPGESFECPRNDPGCREKLVKIDDRVLWARVIRFALVSLAAMTIGAGVKIGWDHWPWPQPKHTVEQLLTDVWPGLKQKQ